MNLSPEVAVAIGVLYGLVAYVLGRNAVLWFLIGYLLPVAAWLLLLVRHKNVRKDSPEWILNFVNRVKLKMWARDLKPEDFHIPPKSDEA